MSADDSPDPIESLTSAEMAWVEDDLETAEAAAWAALDRIQERRQST